MDHRAVFSKLAERAIDDLRALPPPVVRLSGPLTTGGFGYEENMRWFEKAEEILRQKGYPVFSYAPYEKTIYEVYDPSMHGDLMECFHTPIMESELLSELFSLPGAEQSKGASIERALAEKVGMKVSEFPEAWFSE